MICWIEVRPLKTAKFEPGNLAGILEILYNLRKPFRFYVVNAESPIVKGRRTVRFFFEFPDETMKNFVSKVLSASLNVEVVETQPPKATFKMGVELELARHYALPLFRIGEKASLNPVDGIIGALSKEGAFEIVACGDPGARTGINKYIYEKTHGKASFSKTVADMGFGVLGEASVARDPKDISREAWGKYVRPKKEDLWVKKEVEVSEEKINHNLFTCEVRIYGDNAENVETVRGSLPSGINRFKRHRTVKRVLAPLPLRKPCRFSWKNLLHPLWWIVPLVIICSSWFFKILVLFRFEFIDMAIIVTAALSAVAISLLLSRKNPTVLSIPELSLILSLPSAIGRLPIELGITPLSREALPHTGEEQKVKLLEEVEQRLEEPLPLAESLPVGEQIEQEEEEEEKEEEWKSSEEEKQEELEPRESPSVGAVYHNNEEQKGRKKREEEEGLCSIPPEYAEDSEEGSLS